MIDLRPALLKFQQAPGESWLQHFYLDDAETGVQQNLSTYAIIAEIYENGTLIDTLNESAGITISPDNLYFTLRKDWVSIVGGVLDPPLSDIALGIYDVKIWLQSADGVQRSLVYCQFDVTDIATDSARVDSNILVHKILVKNGIVVGLDTINVIQNFQLQIAQAKAEQKLTADFVSAYLIETEEKGQFFGDIDGYVFLEITEEQGLKTAYDVIPYNDSDVERMLFEKYGIVQAEENGVIDREGYVASEYDENGLNYPDKLGKSQLEGELKEKYNILPYFPGENISGDIDGYVVTEITEEGLQFAGNNTPTIISSDKPKPKLPALYCLLSEQGQSLSNSGASAVAVDMYNIKTFAGGILTSYDPDTPGAADAYFGTGLVPCATSGTETQMKRLARVWKDLLRDENGIAIEDQQVTFVVNSAGAGGISLAAIADKNGDYYRRTLESMRRLRDFAIAEGKTANCPVFVYVQGENSADKSDSIATHYAKLESLFDNLNTDAKAIFNQQNDMQFIIYQIASFPQNPPATVNVPLAQLKISLEKPNVHFGCAMYQMEYSDALHGTTVTYQKMGGLMGVVAKRIISDEVKMKPIYPKSWTIQSNTAGTLYTLAVKFYVPVEPLVFDESVNSLYLADPENYGFSMLNAGVEIIQSATIEYGNTIVFVCSQNPSGKELTYAIGGRDAGGNLRDSQGEAIKIHTDVGMLPAHNWAPIFKIVI